MFLVDDKGIVCKLGVFLIWKFENLKYFKDFLYLFEIGKFLYYYLEIWKNSVV